VPTAEYFAPGNILRILGPRGAAGLLAAAWDRQRGQAAR
jgi:hypothetical protein